MDENFKKEGKQLSVMEMFSKTQARLDQLPSAVRASDSMLRMAQYGQMNSAASIASEAFQQSSLMPSYLENQSAIARFAQSRAERAVAFQDTFLEVRKGLSTYNHTMSVRDRIIQSMGGINVHKDIIASVKLAKDLVEPFRSSLDVACTVFEANESFKLVKELQSHAFLSDSLFSEYAGAFKQLESLHNLESFKAISRLKNFPIEDMVLTDFNDLPVVKDGIDKTILEIDSELSDELFLVDDFNEISEEQRNTLLDLYRNYYYPIILTCLVIGIWWNVFLHEDLDLSNKIFVYFESTKGVLSYLGDNFYRPSSGVIDGLVASFIYVKFPEFKKNSKAIGVKKAIKMLFDSSDSVINRSMLKGCRVITKDDTSLRENHHIDAIEIESLSKGTIVRVVEKEGKSWLLVEFLFNTEMGKGWILRSATTTFK